MKGDIRLCLGEILKIFSGRFSKNVYFFFFDRFSEGTPGKDMFLEIYFLQDPTPRNYAGLKRNFGRPLG